MVQRMLETLEHTLKHRFHDPALLEQALTHSSLAFEKSVQSPQEEKPANSRDEKPTLDNEKLEFLGDAVLGLLVAQSLYESFPDLEEGDLTRLRAALVSRKHLANVAEMLHLGDHLRLGRGENGRPARDFGADKTIECGRVALGLGWYRTAEPGQRVAHNRVIECLVEGVGKPGDHLGRDSFRRK